MYSNIYNILMYSSVVPSQFLISVLLQEKKLLFLEDMNIFYNASKFKRYTSLKFRNERLNTVS